MVADEKKPAYWFAIGLVSSLLLCFCLAVSVFSFNLLGTTISSFFAGDGDEPTPTPEAVTLDRVSTPTVTFESLPTAEDMDIRLARESAALLAETIVPVSDPISLSQRLRGMSGIPSVLVESADPVPLGATESFWITDNQVGESFEIQAEMVYATDHVYFWVEDGVTFNMDDAIALVDGFETKIYPANREFFGSEWSPGVDGDPHLYILYAHGLGFSVAGLYGSIDEYSPMVHPFSNGHEMFYISADNLDLLGSFTFGVLAHEFQHMIHWYQDSNESTWLNEGFSEYAMLLNGYSVGGHEYIFASDPDQTLDYWPNDEGSSAHYGQAFLFVTYFLDRFGAEITQMLIANPANGLDSIDLVLESSDSTDPQSGEPIGADDVFADWSVAMWLQDPSFADGRFGYKSYDPPFPGTSDTIDTCPLEEQSRQVNQYGIDYIKFECAGNFNVTFDGVHGVPVIPEDPHSGDYAFWSNRGDTSDMTLTRAFDFRDLSGEIRFDYWLWYDIEEDWDYVYLLVSADDGGTWQFVQTPSGTDTNPTGNSYGWGYTGPSGGEEFSQWIQESVDLSPYAGQQVLIRFEYVTDAAVNGEGLLLDDLSIEALDYREDFESGDGGWVSEGFVRLYNLLPQTYRLILVEEGTEINVREIPLDAEQHATFEIAIGDVYDEAVLIVIGTTRHTWNPAYYRFQVQP